MGGTCGDFQNSSGFGMVTAKSGKGEILGDLSFAFKSFPSLVNVRRHMFTKTIRGRLC